MSKFMKLYESTKTQLTEDSASKKEKDLVKKASDFLKQINAKDDEVSDAQADFEHYDKKSYKNKADRLQKQSDKLSDKFGKIIRELWKMDSKLASKQGLFDGLDESEFLEEAKIKGQEGSVTTQLDSPKQGNSVLNAAKKAEAKLDKDHEVKRILEYGAGYGHGKAKLEPAFPDAEIKQYEPFPQNWQPDYTVNTAIKGKYDIITCNNVLNVVPKDIRDSIVKDIAKLLEVGGAAAIGVRGWKTDILKYSKNSKPADEEKAVIQFKKVKGQEEPLEVFQKGWDGNEFTEYVDSLLGSEYEVSKGTGFGLKGAIIKRLS